MLKKISAGIIFKDKKVLACQRKKGDYYELKWEFPGGTVEENETNSECLIRELKEELNITPIIHDVFSVKKFKYPDGFEFEITFFLIFEFSGIIKNNVFEIIKWVDLEEMQSLDFLEADKDILSMLINRFSDKKI